MNEFYRPELDKLPFIDNRLIQQVITSIVNRENDIIECPYELSRQEIIGVKKHLQQHHGSLVNRTWIQSPSRLTNGTVGSMISIRNKRKNI